MNSLLKKTAALTLACLTIHLATQSDACTAVTLKASDGAAIQARTMEWGAFDLQSSIMVVPRGTTYEGDTPDHQRGLQWTAEYGAVGINGLGRPMFTDGLNEKGLAVSVLYLPGFASYQPYREDQASNSISQSQVADWLLTTCATTDDVRATLPEIRVIPVGEEAIGGHPAPLHWMVTDPSGSTIVIEYVKQQLNIHDNTVGVMTNSPDFEWHLTNLSNYVNLGVEAPEKIMVGDYEVTPVGAGSGLAGLPGDFTPPSRFVRAAAFRNTVPELADGPRAIEEAFRILNNFDIPIGTMGGAHDPAILGDTQWTSAMDTRSLRYYYRTMRNHRIRVVDLNTIDFTRTGIRTKPLDPQPTQDYKPVEIK